ncbi:olfactory receptor 10G4-like isoform X2 [Seriola dumerili]|uniref:olfactory receptor 10G4-like isoform X2 n=1 Tax=Seriola dumerili TaxID=41447 RepID=UPI000BBF1C9E|nr:olfactory receptor 10G4-like isoform X2 [Seriola dumerili]
MVCWEFSTEKSNFENRCDGNKTIRAADQRELCVMDVHCNVTILETQMQINSTIFHLVKMVSMCVSYTLNVILSLPLLLVITRPPSLLRHTRFLLLTHLLLCDNLQLLWTVKAVLLRSREGIPVAHCLIFCAAIQACSLVDLLLSTALAVDRFVAVKWPLRYEFLMCPQRRRAIVAAIWILSVVLSGVGLCISLSTIQVNFSFPRCRPLILTPCLSGTSAMLLYCTVGTAVVVPLCSLTILGCFCLLCWDMHAGLLCTKRASVTLTLQAVQTLLFSVPVVMDSYLIPGYLHSDTLDLAATIIFNLGVSLIPLVYGYRSRELQQRIREAAHRNKVINQNWS